MGTPLYTHSVERLSTDDARQGNPWLAIAPESHDCKFSMFSRKPVGKAGRCNTFTPSLFTQKAEQSSLGTTVTRVWYSETVFRLTTNHT
jgi:hypothetical protein